MLFRFGTFTMLSFTSTKLCAMCAQANVERDEALSRVHVLESSDLAGMPCDIPCWLALFLAHDRYQIE